MLLKLLSIPELDFYKSWVNGWNKIKKLNNFDKYMTIFWFLGPFIYLIERDPADLWLTLIGLIFLVRCIAKKDWSWSSQLWFKCALGLWLYGLFSALTGPDPMFTFQQGIVWIRFPLYAAAAQAWLAKDRDIRVLMFLSIMIGMLIMCAILVAETIIEPKSRLSWPYGDLVPGGYIAKVSLPVFAVLMAIAVSKTNRAGLLSGIFGFFSIIVSILTGERTHFLIRACGGMLAALVWKPKLKLYATLILVEILAVITVFIIRPDLGNNFTNNFVKQIPIVNMDTGYWGSWRGGIQQGLMTPIKGIGPSGTRNTCINLDTTQPEWLPGKNNCGNHPHNIYVQLFAEVGIIGLILGSIMFVSITVSCFQVRKTNFNCPMAATAFVIPFGLFFPLQQFGSFYGQWGNLFIWFAVGFALSQVQNYKKIP